MSQEEQGKKTSPAEKLPAGKDDKVPVPAKPTALSDEDLDKVAAGAGGLVMDIPCQGGICMSNF